MLENGRINAGQLVFVFITTGGLAPTRVVVVSHTLECPKRLTGQQGWPECISE